MGCVRYRHNNKNKGRVLKLAADFQGSLVNVRLDGALLPRRHHILRVDGLGTELQICIALAATGGVDAYVITRGQEVLVADIALTSRVELRPFAVSRILWQKIVSG